MHASLHKDPNWDQPAQSLNATNQKLREDIIGYIKTQIGNRTDLLEKVRAALSALWQAHAAR